MATDQKSTPENRRSGVYTPVIGARHTTVITRGSSVGLNSSPARVSLRQSFSPGSGTGAGNIVVQQGVYANVTGKGVKSMKESKERDKKDMQNLNERFATYIEKVRFLEAQNKALMADIEKMKKSHDPAKIRDMYNVELEQARSVIDELSKQKSEFDVKMVGLEDRLKYEQAQTDDEMNRADAYKEKYDKMLVRVGQLEGESATWRDRCHSGEEDMQTMRNTITRIRDDNIRLRADLDNETMSHLNMANKSQTQEEELAFVTNVYEQEIRELQALANKDNSADIREYWKGELSKAIREIQNEYDNRLGQINVDMDSKYNDQIREIRLGTVNTAPPVDNGFVKEENKKMRTKIIELNSKVSELQARNAFLESQMKSLNQELDDKEKMFDAENDRLKDEIGKLQNELETVLREIQVLVDAKLTLELEIAAYRKLLEVEEGRLNRAEQMPKISLRKTVDEPMVAAISKLAQCVPPMTTSENTGRITVQRSSRGVVAFRETSPDGRFIIIENTSLGKKCKTQNIDGWKIKRVLADSTCVEYAFDKLEIAGGMSTTIWCAGAKDKKAAEDLVTDFFTWGTGSSTTYLYDNEGAEKATVVQKFVI